MKSEFEVAQVAANIEAAHDLLVTYDGADEIGGDLNLDGMRVVSFDNYVLQPGEYYIPDRDCSKPFVEPSIKAVTLMDDEGNLYVHFFGTGDGNWVFNAVAYSDDPDSSSMQKWALDYFNESVATYQRDNPMRSVYVSGHSQGGNLAQFVTVESVEYGDYIDKCVSLDGPGFSKAYVEDLVNRRGEAVYDMQREKIYQYIGENDYVSPLGQEFIYTDDHVAFLEYTLDHIDLKNFHAVTGLLDSNGKIHLVGDTNGNGVIDPGEVNDCSDLRKLIVSAVSKMYNLPMDKQAKLGILVMMFFENVPGADQIIQLHISSEEFEELKQLLIPVLVDIISADPELFERALESMGIGPETSEMVKILIEHFNTYSPSVRKEIIEGILEMVKYENGKIDVDNSKIPQAFAKTSPVLPYIFEVLLTHPGDIIDVLHEYKVDEAIKQAIIEHPWKTAGLIIGGAIIWPIISPIVMGAFDFVVITLALYDAAIRIIQGIEELYADIKEKLVALLGYVKNVIKSFSQWYRNNFNAGVKYVASNPYFKADTSKLRSYAARIDGVNSRLRSLDSAMRTLYNKVGFLDLLTILQANLVTSESPTLMQVRRYLNNTADRIDNAEKKVKSYVGG